MRERASAGRMFVAGFVGAIAASLTQMVTERYLSRLPARTVGAMVFNPF